MTADIFNDEEFDFPRISEIVMAAERLIFNVTEDLLLVMQDSGITQAELAKKMGKSKPFISQILNGERNLTLKTLSDITYALEAKVKLSIIKNGRDVSHQIAPEREGYIETSNVIEAPTTPILRIFFTTPEMDYMKDASY